MDNINALSYNKAFFEGKYLAHPQCPIGVRDLWLEEAMFTSKYVVAVMDCHADKMIPWLAEQVHLLCFVEDNPDKIDLFKHSLVEYYQQEGYKLKNISFLHANSLATQIDSDVIDFVVLGQNWMQQKDKKSLQKELQNILRLNSYVTLCLHHIKLDSTPFAQAYAQLLKQYQVEDDYQHLPNSQTLNEFFNHQYAVNAFANQLRFSAETWELYIKSSYYYQALSDSRRSLFLRACKILFAQYCTSAEGLYIDFETNVYIGIFNKYTPAISLRKNIFFHLLRPFAFLFYILLKSNVYFWKIIYRLTHWKKHKD